MENVKEGRAQGKKLKGELEGSHLKISQRKISHLLQSDHENNRLRGGKIEGGKRKGSGIGIRYNA